MRIDFLGGYGPRYASASFATELALPKKQNTRSFSFDGSSDENGSWTDYPGHILTKKIFNDQNFATLYLNSKSLSFRNLTITKDALNGGQLSNVESDLEEITFENVTIEEGAFKHLELAKLIKVTINNTPFTTIKDGILIEYKTDIQDSDLDILTLKAINKEKKNQKNDFGITDLAAPMIARNLNATSRNNELLQNLPLTTDDKYKACSRIEISTVHHLGITF